MTDVSTRGRRTAHRAIATATATTALSLLTLGFPGIAGAAAGGNSNQGDIWTDTVGQQAGPGHEQDPHLPCADINLWANGLAYSSDSYTIDGWAPSGTDDQAYSGVYGYDVVKGGNQVADVIDVNTLISNAIANGDAPVNKQGFHFKIQFTQAPQKHKTFWVACTSAPGGYGGGGYGDPNPPRYNN